MLGAIIGDMVGSVYEFHSIKSKEFYIYNSKNRMTDDSILTLSVARTLLKHYPIDYSSDSIDSIKKDLVKDFVKTCKENPHRGYGGFFRHWLYGENGYKPYNSFGNGSAMRISPVGWIANSEQEVKILSKAVSEITHNHPEGIKGAEAVAMCIYFARVGKDKDYIKEYMVNNYYPEIANFDFDQLIKYYEFNSTCQRSVPQAIYCFLISTSLEDAIRNCVAIGGDCDTIGAMAGAISEAYYQKDKLSELENTFFNSYIEPQFKQEIKEFYKVLNINKLQ